MLGIIANYKDGALNLEYFYPVHSFLINKTLFINLVKFHAQLYNLLTALFQFHLNYQKFLIIIINLPLIKHQFLYFLLLLFQEVNTKAFYYYAL